MNPLIKFDPKSGMFVASSTDAYEQMNALVRSTGRSGDLNEHKAMGATIIPPIAMVAAYSEWTNLFFVDTPVNFGEIIRVAVNNKIAIAMHTSLNGEPMLVRPGRKYTTINAWQTIDAGLEISWDDMKAAGWPLVETKMLEVGEVLARKRDTAGKAILDAAVSTSSHAVTSTGSVLTKTAVDTVIKAAAAEGWQLDRVAINPSTMMDQTNWVWTNNNGLWQTSPALGDQVLTKGRISNYGGLNWYENVNIPTDKVYFSAAPAVTGAKRFKIGETRNASDSDIFKRVDYHVYDETWSYYIQNPYPVWCITISA